MANNGDVYTAAVEERNYQDEKWGTIEDHPHSLSGWLLIMEHELAEAKTAYVKSDNPIWPLVEVLQVIAVGFACLEQHGVYTREDFETLKNSVSWQR